MMDSKFKNKNDNKYLNLTQSQPFVKPSNIMQESRNNKKMSFCQTTSKQMKNRIKINLIMFTIGSFLFVFGYIMGAQFSKQIKEYSPVKNAIIVSKREKEQNISQTSINFKQKSSDQSEQQHSQWRFFSQYIFNQENKGRNIFRKKQYEMNFTSNLGQINRNWPKISLQFVNQSEQSKIFTINPIDFNKIQNNIDFESIKKNLINQLTYQLLELKINPLIDVPKTFLEYKYFKNHEQIQNYLKGYKISDIDNSEIQNQLFQLAVNLFKNPSSIEALEAQYYLADKRYNISKMERELPICVIGTSYQIFSSNKFQKFFQSINRVNYTNFHIVFIDDNSPDESGYKIYDYIRNSNMQIKNKIKIIRNLQQIGDFASILIFTQKYCKSNQIFININFDNQVIGRQFFNILSVIYQNQSTWYASSRYFGYQQKKSQFLLKNQQKYLQTDQIQNNQNEIFKQINVKTFRAEIIKKIPIHYFIQYYVDFQTGIGWPEFTKFQFSRYQIKQLLLQQLNKNETKLFVEYPFISIFTQQSKERECFQINSNIARNKFILKTTIQKHQYLTQKIRKKNQLKVISLNNKVKNLLKLLQKLKCRQQN